MRRIFWSFILVLALVPSAALAQQTVLVKAQSLTMREKPVKNGATVTKLTSFQPVEFLKKDGDWAQVRNLQKQTGYVLADYLTANAFAYTGGEKVSGRRGPGTQYEVIIEYTEPNIPLRVCDASADGWVMVMDYEGDRSWVSAKGLQASQAGARYVITKQENCNVRKGVGIGQDLVFTAQKGVILKAIEEKDGWLHVKYADGDEGWLSSKLVFGWSDVPAPATGKSSNPSVPTPTPTPKAGKTSAKKTTTKSGTKTGSSKAGKKKAATTDDTADDTPAKTSTKTSTKAAGKKKAATTDDTADDPPAKSTTRTKASAKKKAAPADDTTDDPPAKTTSRTKASAKKKAAPADDTTDDPPAKKTTRKSTAQPSDAVTSE